MDRAHKKGRNDNHCGLFLNLNSAVDQFRDRFRRPAASKASPPNANRAKVAGSGVGTAVLLILVTKLPEFSDELGLIESVIVLIMVNCPLKAARLAPTEL